MTAPLIVAATEEEVRYYAARRWPDEASRKLYLAMAHSSPCGAWVARDDATPIGIGFSHASDEERFVSELFVEPSYRGAGIGRELMQAILSESGDEVRSGVVSANEPASLAFVARRGVALHVPVLRVAGPIPREEELVRMASGDYRFAAGRIDLRIHGAQIDSLDREVRGSSRRDDHVLFSDAATGTAFVLGDECVGYAYVWPDGRIGPLAASSGAYMVQFLAFALASLARTHGASWCTALVPGSNVRILRAAMRIGLSVDEVKVFATDHTMLELSRYAGFHPLLF